MSRDECHSIFVRLLRWSRASPILNCYSSGFGSTEGEDICVLKVVSTETCCSTVSVNWLAGQTIWVTVKRSLYLERTARRLWVNQHVYKQIHANGRGAFIRAGKTSVEVASVSGGVGQIYSSKGPSAVVKAHTLRHLKMLNRADRLVLCYFNVLNVQCEVQQVKGIPNSESKM